MARANSMKGDSRQVRKLNLTGLENGFVVS